MYGNIGYAIAGWLYAIGGDIVHLKGGESVKQLFRHYQTKRALIRQDLAEWSYGFKTLINNSSILNVDPVWARTGCYLSNKSVLQKKYIRNNNFNERLHDEKKGDNCTCIKYMCVDDFDYWFAFSGIWHRAMNDSILDDEYEYNSSKDDYDYIL